MSSARSAGLARRCANHPAREAAASCKSCRTPLCAECATRFEGINYCVRCIAALRAGGRERSSALGVLAWLGVTGGLAFAAVHLIAWMGALLAGSA